MFMMKWIEERLNLVSIETCFYCEKEFHVKRNE